MLKIRPEFVHAVQNASSLAELFPMLQNAIELEHSTIPPYLTALFSFKPDAGKDIRVIIHSIVIEEMLHMTIAANILNAIGGHPAISHPKFVPDYPTPLPMHIGGSLVVGIEKYSLDVVKNVFMEIEEPEDPIDFNTETLTATEITYKTIGEFYRALQAKLREIAPEVLPGNPAKQVTSGFFSPKLLFPILTKADAINAINIIVEQGEGSDVSPLGTDGEMAHFYKFEELYNQRELVKDPDDPAVYSFTGAVIPFDPADVLPLYPNTKADMLPQGSEERRLLDSFNQTYSNLLFGLHQTFNGHPGNLNNTIGLMFDLRLACQKLAQMPFPGKDGYTIGPSYEFVQPTTAV